MGTKRISVSRRNFIKKAAAVAGTILATSASGPFAAVIFKKEEQKYPGPWYGYAIDIKKCIGCGKCAIACKMENDVPREPFYYRTWIELYTIKKDGEVIVESPNGGIDGFSNRVPEDEIFKTFFVPKMCNQCAKSPCTQVCPVGATYESPEGVTLIDDEYCIGCRYCIQACPYGCRFLHPVKKVASKCTLCYHRITKGMKPACVEICPRGARMFGDLNEEEGELVQFLQAHNCQVLKPNLNTGAKLYYNELSAEVR